MDQRCLGRPVIWAVMLTSARRSEISVTISSMYRVALGGTTRHHVVDLGVALGVQRGEAQILELLLDLRHAESMGQRGVDVEGLLRRAFLFPGGHAGERAHVVETVGQLDDQHPQVLGHRHQHLAHGGGLLGLLGVELDPLQLGDPVDDGGDLGTEVLVDSSTVSSVSSTASCRSAAAMVTSSMPYRATIPATASGWVM